MPTDSLRDHAEENLQYIRATMDRATTLTAISGWGGVAMGVTALAAAALAWRQTTSARWIVVWLIEALVAIVIGVVALTIKSRRLRLPLDASPARRFAFSFSPSIAAGALLTAELFRSGMSALLPPVWLLLYGSAVVGGGTFSVPAIRTMGVLIMMLGAIALAAPPALGDAFLALGFGVLQIVFGFFIARRYGG